MEPTRHPSDELTQLRRDVQAVLDEWLTAARFRPSCDAWLRSYDSEFSKVLAQHAWIGITWPTQLGGGGRSNLARLVVTEELLRTGAPVAAHWIADRQIGPAILRYGSASLQRRYLPRIAAGDVTFCLGMSETESGSDLASVRTSAVKDREGWRITGRKIWTSQAHRSTHAYVLTRTSRGENKHEGLTEFIVDMSAPGVDVRPIYDLRGEHHFNEVTFDDVAVPNDHLLGDVGNGWSQVTEQLSFERGGMERVLSTYPLLAAVLDVIHGRGTPTTQTAAQVGTVLARLTTLRHMAWQIAESLDAGVAPTLEAAMLKDLGTTFERDVNELARQLLGAEADPDAQDATGLLAQGVLAAPGFSIRGGTTEVLRTIIARGTAADSGRRAGGDVDGVRGMADDVLNGRGGDPPEGLPDAWALMHELGWSGVGLAEERGGSGGTLGDLSELTEALGRHTTSVPLAETALAARCLVAAGRQTPNGVATVVLSNPGSLITLSRTSEGMKLAGKVTRVPWAALADVLVVYAVDVDGADVAVVVPAGAPGLSCIPGRNLAGEPRDTVTLDAVDVSANMLLSGAPDPLAVRALGGLLRATSIVGALENAMDHTVAHVTVREQFGRPLLRFQAVSQSLARMASEMASARTATAAAVDAWQGREDAIELVAVARVVTAAAATELARTAHQLHGAMGVTREHPLHLATRRLWSWRDEWGTEQEWGELLGQRLLARGSGGIWRWLTEDNVQRGAHQ